MMSDPIVPAKSVGNPGNLCRYARIAADPESFGLSPDDDAWLREYATAKLLNPEAHDSYDVVALKVRREAYVSGYSTTLGPATISRHINGVCVCQW